MESPPPELAQLSVAQKDAMLVALMEEVARLQALVRDLEARLTVSFRPARADRPA